MILLHRLGLQSDLFSNLRFLRKLVCIRVSIHTEIRYIRTLSTPCVLPISRTHTYHFIHRISHMLHIHHCLRSLRIQHILILILHHLCRKNLQVRKYSNPIFQDWKLLFFLFLRHQLRLSLWWSQLQKVPALNRKSTHLLEKNPPELLQKTNFKWEDHSSDGTLVKSTLFLSLFVSFLPLYNLSFYLFHLFW